MKIIQALSSKLVYRFAILGWIIQGIYAIFFMAPSTDDGLYLSQSIATFHHWTPGTWIGQHFYPVFFDMATLPFFNGLFYKILYWFGIVPGPYTFRLFIFICLAALFALSIKLITRLTSGLQRNNYLAKNIFLISLAITPFALACWSLRPEVLGLTFLIAALLFFLKASDQKKLYYWAFCGILLGLAAIVHPIMAIIGGMIGLGIFLKLCVEHKFRQLFILIISAAIPCLVFLLWFFIHKDTAIAQLTYRATSVHSTTNHLRGINYIIRNINPFSNDKGLLIGLYSTMFYLPLIPLALLCIILLCCQRLYRYNWKEILRNPLLWLPLASVVSVVFILFNIKMYGPYLLVLSFLLALSIACSLINLAQNKKSSQPSRLKFSIMMPAVLLTLLIVDVNTLAQASKFFLNHKDYYRTSITKKQVIPQLKPNDQLIITGQRLLPPFAKLMMGSTKNNRQVHCTFCAGAGYLAATLWKKEASEYINGLAKQNPKDLVWGVMKQDLYYRNKNKSLCFLLKGYPAPVLLSDGQVIFEDAGNIFYRPKNMRIGKLNESCKQLRSPPKVG